MRLYQITLNYACAGIEIGNSGRCCKAAPIFKWMLNKTQAEIEHWVKSKKGTFILVDSKP
jgi:hypothetical protein